MGERAYPGGFEALVLMAVLRLGENAYGKTIRQEVEERGERTAAIGAIYTTLERLEGKGFITSRKGEPTPERGGRAKRYFKIEGAGMAALEEMQRAHSRMLEGVSLGGLQPAGGAA